MKTEKFNSEIAARLKWLRKIKGYTIATVADVIGLSPCGYSKIENNDRKLSLENCAMLAKFYGTTCDFIINGTYETNAVMFIETNLNKASEMLADLSALLSNTSDRAMYLDVKPTEVVPY